MSSPRSPAYIRRLKTIGFIFFLPTLVYMVFFLLGPIITAVLVSFSKYTVLSPPQFVGLQNFARIFTMPSFWHSLKVTFLYIFVRLGAILILAFFMGLVINQRIPLRGFYQAVYFMPYVFPLAVTSIIWKLFYRPFGLIEQLTSVLGIGYIPWLTSERTVLIAITITTVWSAAGYYAIVILAGLQTIPKDVLEASVIDGAGNLRRFFSIIIPLLKPTLFYIVIVGTINSIRGFPPFLIMTGGGPGETTRVIGLMIYEYGFTMLKMGVASAMSVVLLVIILAFTMIQQRLYVYGGE